MLRRVTLVRTDVLEEIITSTNVVLSTPILITLMMEATHSSGTSILTKATRSNIPEDGILLSYVVHKSTRIVVLLISRQSKCGNGMSSIRCRRNPYIRILAHQKEIYFLDTFCSQKFPAELASSFITFQY
jgi:hypothetical protein